MRLWDWLFEQEKKEWVVMRVGDGTFLTSRVGSPFTRNPSEAARLSKSEAKRLSKELSWLYHHIYIEAEEAE